MKGCTRAGDDGRCPRDGRRFVNWARTVSCTPLAWEYPSSVAGVQAVLRAAVAAGRRVRVVGAGRSPNDICCAPPDGIMLSLDRLNRVLQLDVEARTVRAEAGMRLWDLNERLAAAGLALPNLGSISDQSLAGAGATGTHGSGWLHGIHSTAWLAVELVTASGDVLRLSPQHEPELFRCAQLSLGALGVIVAITLKVVPAFDIVFEDSPTRLDAVLADLPARVAACDFYRFFYYPHTDKVYENRMWAVPPAGVAGGGAGAGPQPHPAAPPRFDRDRSYSDLADRLPLSEAALAVMRRADAVPPPSRAARVQAWLTWVFFAFHVLQALLYLSLYLPQLVPWINRLYAAALFSSRRVGRGRSDAVFNFDCLFRQHVAEFAVPAAAAPAALRELRAEIAARGFRAHFPIEVRFVAGDDIPLSPASGAGRDGVCFIGIIAYRPYGTDAPHADYFAMYERVMERLGGRPHWAKAFRATGAELAPRYADWAVFQRARARLDPGGVFVNAFTARVLLAATPSATR
jgi:L-gulonolactone oxidase